MTIVKIGKEWINMDCITNILEGHDGRISLYDQGAESSLTSFTGEEAKALRHWLDRVALDVPELYRRSMEEAEAQVAKEKAYAPMQEWAE